MIIKLFSNAKINLALSINHKRADGYHDISSIMQEIDLCDIIEVSKNDSGEISLISKGIKVPEDESNLCYIATKIFLKEHRISHGINITIDKKIPIGAGLGGGSGNAATVIKALSKLFDISLQEDIFYKMCSYIGADVAFFYHGGIQYAQGIGNKLTQFSPLLTNHFFLLVFPKIEISTSWAYAQYKKYLENQSNPSNFLPLSDNIDWSLWKNDFEKVVLSTYPEIKKIKSDLQNTNSLFTSLSGSGSTMFGVYDNLESVRNAQDLFKGFQTHISLPVY